MSTLLTLLDALDDRPQAVDLRERTYSALGDVVVDVGCGSGRAVGELAARGVRAIGVDADPAMIETAAARWPAGEFHVADATALPLHDGSVTGYRADKVLHVLPEPARAVGEARRVLAPGGRAVLTGQDWDTIVIDSDDPARTRSIVHARADGMPHPRIARRYRNLLLDNGFTDVTVDVHTLVWTDSAALPVLANLGGEGAWLAEQAARARDDRLFVAVPIFLTAGTRAG
ncbi:methyltransferase probably involved in ubiquinone/menaquinone biosynthesis [Amycolatopsis mediterranei S699]|uniref:Methyltransferase probably involved in ubiquinone/menaquinone biosynthesis n=2 Tax=Amycolatopsis mediterranei TaxID=33910 RepID=A0A0H3D7X5_AMYMU|nr:methyltransferase domain-containing protein [Amycolatopsis mediterranei]ADJ46397.1 methyltransferase probably involved in ubiquinone/menaquinone biosynthesis [Amycolatopsis mediterranei U32]AEK43193.1 methyltransferase probably involved in ubiquinone/menaquinone biosynthesis [Amycolatopsis mediterranei S699]AFO78108.1 methyltransferase probably involved in ubiquinone/menaquinone biosynthesis [Amycolatopsis mediterranei S699]AGT85236.1 methyltransferase probably involved in ubiquinone/menaqui